MAQLLQVIKDPSIVRNVPTTPLEQLQIATEKKAAEMAAARNGAQPTAISTRPTEAQMQALRTVAKALQPPITHSAIATQERLTDTPPPILAFDGDQHTGMTSAPGLAAIDGATQPWGPGPMRRPFAAPLFGDMPRPNGVAVPDTMGLRGVPAQGFARDPSTIPPVRSSSPMIAAQQQPQVPPGQVMIASGKTVPIGATGTAQGGRYSYVVQSDGSIAKTINPMTPAVAQQRTADMASVTQSKGFPGSGIY